MALSDKNILITPNRGQTADPKIDFVGANSTVGPQTITLNVYPASNGTISFSGSAGELFSIINNLSGTIFSVNDVSGIPSIEVFANGQINLAQFGGNVGIGNSAPTDKVSITGTLFASGNANVGNLITSRVLASANVTAPQLISNIATGTAPLVVTSTTQVANLNAATAGTATSATNAAAVQSNTSVNSVVYLTGTSSSANGNVALEKVTGIQANFASNSISATTFFGNITNASSIAANAANGVVFGNSHTASGAMSGNLNVSTVTGNLGIRALASTYTDNVAAAGNVANAAVHALGTPTLVASNAITTTNAATFFIQGAPTASTNVTITNGYALHVGAGNSLFAGTVTAGNLSTGGTLSVTGNANVGNLGTAQVLATANVTAPQLISNVATGTAPLVVTSTTQVANLNVATAGSATSATNAAAVQSNTSTSATAYLLTTATAGNANVSLEKVSGIFANLANNSITATTFVGTITSATNASAVLTNTSTNTQVYLTGTQSAANGNVSLEKVTGIYANMSNNSITATTFVGTLSGAATSATNAAALLQNTSTATTVYPTFTTSSANGNSQAVFSTGISANLANNSITATTFVGTVSSATNAAAVQSNTSTSTTTYLLSTATAGNANVSLEKVTGITANLANNSITATTFVGSLSGAATSATSATNAAAVQSNTSTSTTAYLLTTATAGNANVSLEKVSGIFANLANNSITATTFVGTVSSATSATNAAAVQSNTSTTNTVYLLGTGTAANGNVSLEKVTGITANFAANTITATQFIGTHVGNVVANVANGTVISNNITASGAASGNANVSTVTGNLGIRAIASTYTDNVSAAGTVANAAIHAIATPTLTAANAITTTNLSTFFIQGAPTASTNVTATNSYALFVAGGNSLFNGNLVTGSGSGGNISGANVITANTFVGNVSATTVSGNLTTAAQGNITSVGTLTGLTANGNVTVNVAAGNRVSIAASAPPTADMLQITNTGQGTITAGVSGVQLTFVGGAAAVEASAYRTDLTPGATTGGTWNGFRMVASAAAASGVTMNAIKIDALSAVGAGGDNAIYVGANWDNIVNYNGTSIIYGNGKVNGAEVVGTVPTSTNAAAVQSNTSTNNTVYLLGTQTAANGNVSLEKVTGITANFAANTITATQFIGTHVGNVVANVANGVIFGNSHTASGAMSGNINVATITGNLGIRALASTYTDNVAAAGTIANAAIHSIATPTVAASNAITTTNLSTFYIANAPTASTNVTITNGYALFVAAGNSYLAGNVTFAGNILGTLANGNSNVNIPAANGNVNITAVGNATLVVTGTGANVTGYANITGAVTAPNLALTSGASTKLAITANAPPTADMVTITNAGNGVVTAGVNGINLTYVGGAAAVEASAYRTDFTPGATTGGTWNGFRMVAASNAASGVTMNAIKIDNITGGAGTENMIYAGTGWDNIINYNGTSIIYGNGKVNGAEVTGTIPASTNAAAVQSNTTTNNTVYLLGTQTAANGNVSLEKVAGITANFAANTITATQFNGNVVGTILVANGSNGVVFGNSLTASGAATGNANATTITGNLGLRTISSTYTDNSAAASATLANAAIHAIATPTLAAANATVTSTNAATFFIQGAPTAGTNMTITNPYALFVAAGNSYIAGNVTFPGNILGRIANGNSNVNIPAANGNVNITAVGNATLVVTGTGANITGTLNATGNANVDNLGASGVVLSSGATNKLSITATAPPTADMVTITNAGQGVATAGVNGINLTYVGGAAAVEASAYRTDFTPGATTGGTWNGFRMVAASNAASGVTMNAIKIDALPAAGGAGTENAILVGANWDNVVNVNGTSVIYGNGKVNGAEVVGTVANATYAVSAGSISNGTSNVNIATSGGNITMGVGGTANVVTVTSSNIQLGTGSGGNISGANVISANLFIASVATGVSAAGTTQGTATALSSQISVVSTVASGAGVRLPTAIAGMRFTIVNTSANALLVYPATSGIINSQAANAAYSQPAGARLDFISTTTTQWYTLNATYG